MKASTIVNITICELDTHSVKCLWIQYFKIFSYVYPVLPESNPSQWHILSINHNFIDFITVKIEEEVFLEIRLDHIITQMELNKCSPQEVQCFS